MTHGCRNAVDSERCTFLSLHVLLMCEPGSLCGANLADCMPQLCPDGVQEGRR